MTSIKDLQERINSAETVLEALKSDLEELKQQEPESLFGRWATHPKYGRGIIISDHEDTDHEVDFAFLEEDKFAFLEGDTSTGACECYVPTSSLTIDPATLTTVEDYRDAPEGTIVEATMYPKDVAVKTEDGWYRTGGMHAIAVEYMPTCRVIRWGNGK